MAYSMCGIALSFPLGSPVLKIKQNDIRCNWLQNCGKHKTAILLINAMQEHLCHVNVYVTERLYILLFASDFNNNLLYPYETCCRNQWYNINKSNQSNFAHILYDIDGLTQDNSISSAVSMEILLTCIKLWICTSCILSTTNSLR